VDETAPIRHKGQVASAQTPLYLCVMTHRMQINLTDVQYSYLDAEADRSSVSVAELVRRAVDTTYGLSDSRRLVVVEHTLGRRSGRPLDDDAWWGPRGSYVDGGSPSQ
jgi:hypothetical protein